MPPRPNSLLCKFNYFLQNNTLLLDRNYIIYLIVLASIEI